IPDKGRDDVRRDLLEKPWQLDFRIQGKAATVRPAASAVSRKVLTSASGTVFSVQPIHCLAWGVLAENLTSPASQSIENVMSAGVGICCRANRNAIISLSHYSATSDDGCEPLTNGDLSMRLTRDEKLRLLWAQRGRCPRCGAKKWGGALVD